ncbi:MAG: hypothetical protein AB9897_09275 [Anaerolineaceae bacterium]
MKKTGLIFALLLFAACSIVGYLVASKTSIGANSDNSASVNAATAMASPQQNYLLVQVDDLSQSSPKFIQAWIVLTYYSNPPQIMFLPLFPSYDISQNSSLSDSFSLSSSGELSPHLAQKISDLYKVNVDGYIMVDSIGFNAIASWFGIQSIQVSSNAALSDEEKHNLLLNSQSFFLNVCSQLSSGGALNQYNSIQWSQLIPGHFQTNLSFDQLIASWDRIIRSAPPQQCEVLSKE